MAMLIIGEIILFFGYLYLKSIELAARNTTKKSIWTNPIVVDSLHVLIILGSFVLGFYLVVRGVTVEFSVTKTGLGIVLFAVLFSATTVIIKKFRINERIAEFDARNATLNSPDHSPPNKPFNSRAA